MLEHLAELVIKSAYPTLGEDPIFGQDAHQRELRRTGAKNQSASRSICRAETGHVLHYAGADRRPGAAAPFCGSFFPGRVRRFLRGDGRRPDAHHSIERFPGRLPASGGGSKDTWILSDGPVSQMTLLPRAQPVVFSRGGGDLPSRFADDLFWLGRYVERAEARVRLAAPLSSAQWRIRRSLERRTPRKFWLPPRSTSLTSISPVFISFAAFIKGVMGDDETRRHQQPSRAGP